MEVPTIDGKDVEGYTERFGGYLVLTGKTKVRDCVKANLIVHSIKDTNIHKGLRVHFKIQNPSTILCTVCRKCTVHWNLV